MAPPAVLRQRPERRRRSEPVWTPATRNVRAPVAATSAEVPDPPKHGMTPARHARVQVYQSLQIPHIRAVMRDVFAFGKGEHNPLTSMPRGKSLTWNERTNIVRHSPEAYGSSYTLEPISNPQDDRLRALIGTPV